jgi:type IV pilus assembly protein PilB
MVAGRPKLGQFLVKRGVITEEQLDAAVQHQVTNDCRLGESLITLGYCTDAEIAQALAEQLEIPYVDLDETPPSAACVALISREIAFGYGVLPIRMHGNRLLVVCQDPFDIRVDEVVRQATSLQVVLATAPVSQLWALIRQQYSESLIEDSQPLSRDDPEDVDSDDQNVAVEKLVEAGEHVSTVRIVNTVIADGARRGASDIHIEPEQGRIRVRYRIDGRMCPAVVLSSDVLSSIVARIKILCAMDISENRRPQDGGCSVRVDGQSIEIRASTLRGVHGEIVVLRLMSQDAGLHQLDALGFQPDMQREFRALLSRRHGIVLITGPTGSGKTTSLYAALNYLNREDVNIITVEDPVEAKLPGINQIQVHDRAGRSFAGTLRSMLRQDPDIIMVGEIRDAETAEIACRAALTGHLVLSTLHTPHTLGSVARLLDMGLEPWMLSACLNGVLAQRLTRRVCENCAADYTPPAGLKRALQFQFGRTEGARFRQGRGCPQCHKSGTRGRVGIYELLSVDDGFRGLLAGNAGPDRLREHAAARGFQTLEQDAFHKACQGVIAPEEILELGFGLAAAMENRPAPVARVPVGVG